MESCEFSENKNLTTLICVVQTRVNNQGLYQWWVVNFDESGHILQEHLVNQQGNQKLLLILGFDRWLIWDRAEEKRSVKLINPNKPEQPIWQLKYLPEIISAVLRPDGVIILLNAWNVVQVIAENLEYPWEVSTEHLFYVPTNYFLSAIDSHRGVNLWTSDDKLYNADENDEFNDGVLGQSMESLELDRLHLDNVYSVKAYQGNRAVEQQYNLFSLYGLADNRIMIQAFGRWFFYKLNHMQRKMELVEGSGSIFFCFDQHGNFENSFAVDGYPLFLLNKPNQLLLYSELLHRMFSRNGHISFPVLTTYERSKSVGELEPHILTVDADCQQNSLKIISHDYALEMEKIIRFEDGTRKGVLEGVIISPVNNQYYFLIQKYNKNISSFGCSPEPDYYLNGKPPICPLDHLRQVAADLSLGLSLYTLSSEGVMREHVLIASDLQNSLLLPNLDQDKQGIKYYSSFDQVFSPNNRSIFIMVFNPAPLSDTPNNHVAASAGKPLLLLYHVLAD